MRSESAHLVEEVLISFGIRTDPWTMECKDAIDKVERAFGTMRQGGFDEGFDEGQVEANHNNYDEAYDEGRDRGMSDATLHHVVENYMQLEFRIPSIQVMEILRSDSEDEEYVIRYRYLTHYGEYREATNSYTSTELLEELM